MSKAKVKLLGAHELRDIETDANEMSVTLDGKQYSADSLAIDNPISGTVYAAALNYKGVMEKLGDSLHDKPYNAPPKAPVLYIKPVNTYNRFGGKVAIPEGESELAVGASLGIVIGKTAARVSEENALDHIAGYTIVNDVCIPHDSVYRPAVTKQARDGFCPMGPWIADSSAISNPDDVKIRVFVNGELKQESATADLVRPVGRLMAEVTDFMTLHEGDVLLVGVAENAPKAKAGDRVRIEIEGIGYLENTFVAEQQDVWGEGK